MYHTPKYEAPKKQYYKPKTDYKTYKPKKSCSYKLDKLPEAVYHAPVYEAAPVKKAYKEPEPVYEEPEEEYYGYVAPKLAYDYLKPSCKKVEYVDMSKIRQQYVDTYECGDHYDEENYVDGEYEEDYDEDYEGDEYDEDYEGDEYEDEEYVEEDTYEEPSLLEKALSYAHGHKKINPYNHWEPTIYSRAHLAGPDTRYVEPVYGMLNGYGNPYGGYNTGYQQQYPGAEYGYAAPAMDYGYGHPGMDYSAYGPPAYGAQPYYGGYEQPHYGW